MKPKKFKSGLTLNKKTISNLTDNLQNSIKARIKGGYSVYPCEISAPQIICDSVGGYTCNDCGGGTNTCNCSVYPCGESDNQIYCVSGAFSCDC